MPGLTPTNKARTAPVLNAITVDVEDWLQSTVDPNLPLTDCFPKNTHKVLAAFAARGVRGTFFVLGLAAEKAPQLVREIHAAGHEVQSHGYGHRLVHELTPAEFRADLERSKKLLEDITGQEIYGYRAPAFTISRQNLWALDVLVETGYRYDSSVFPLRTARYGIDGAPRFPHILKTSAGHEIRELPVASYEFAGRRFPVGGGGYFRLLPYFILRRGVRQLNAEGHSATIYMHPYEYSPGEFQTLDQSISWKMRLHQGLGRRRFPRRVDRFLTEFRFGAMQDVIDAVQNWPCHAYRPEPDSGDRS
jgi:polysaccharide deacetylase family protein (PEP-CTERM system associated)